MKLLTTCIFLIVSLVMMNSSFAQDQEELIAALKEQTESIKEQTIAMKAIALYKAVEYDVDLFLFDIQESNQDLDRIIAQVKKNELLTARINAINEAREEAK